MYIIPVLFHLVVRAHCWGGGGGGGETGVPAITSCHGSLMVDFLPQILWQLRGAPYGLPHRRPRSGGGVSLQLPQRSAALSGHLQQLQHQPA